MATYSTNEFKGGMKILMDGEPCSIMENEVVKPGKGQAFNRVRFRNLKTGRVLKEQDLYQVVTWNGAAISVTPPNFVELEVVETDPGVKGDTATGGTKPATLSSGAVVRVPLFVNRGDVLKVDTRTGEYQNRVSR